MRSQRRHRHLPHFSKPGASYLVSWSIVRGSPALTPTERDSVIETLRHFDGDRYRLHSAVVMNDHVHALLTPGPDHPLPRILHTWKSYTAHEMVVAGRCSPVWNGNYFDQMIRDETHFANAGRYIERNPMVRWPGIQSYRWWISEPQDRSSRPADPSNDELDPGPPGRD
ncbi:MAG: transposase [Actinomycetota bacterium]|nr:transposase [Actinomycetota bacterium]